MKKTQVTDKNTQKPRRHQKNPDLVEKTQLWQHCRECINYQLPIPPRVRCGIVRRPQHSAILSQYYLAWYRNRQAVSTTKHPKIKFCVRRKRMFGASDHSDHTNLWCCQMSRCGLRSVHSRPIRYAVVRVYALCLTTPRIIAYEWYGVNEPQLRTPSLFNVFDYCGVLLGRNVWFQVWKGCHIIILWLAD